MKSSFPSIELKERHENILQYQLPSHACCLARVFDLLSNNFEELGVVDFSVSQTTLDQVRMTVMDEGNTSVYKGLLFRKYCPQCCNNRCYYQGFSGILLSWFKWKTSCKHLTK